MKRAVLVLSLAIALAASVAVSFAQEPSANPPGPPQGPPPQMGPGPGMAGPMPPPCIITSLRILQSRMMPMLEVHLKLTADQKAKVVDFLSKSEEAMRPLIDAHRKASEVFVDALATTGTTEAALRTAGENVMKAEAALLAERVKTFIGLRALLTNEQNQELNKIMIQNTAPWRPQAPQGPPPPMPQPAPRASEASDTK